MKKPKKKKRIVAGMKFRWAPVGECEMRTFKKDGSLKSIKKVPVELLVF